MSDLRLDYNAMVNMFYGDVPEFDTIIKYLENLQDEIHALGK